VLKRPHPWRGSLSKAESHLQRATTREEKNRPAYAPFDGKKKSEKKKRLKGGTQKEPLRQKTHVRLRIPLVREGGKSTRNLRAKDSRRPEFEKGFWERHPRGLEASGIIQRGSKVLRKETKEPQGIG